MLRRTSLPSVLAVVVVATLGLGGCVAPEPAATPPPKEHAKRVFASDEALAAAEAAYGEYMAMTEEIMHDGGADPERLEGLVSADLLEFEVAGYVAMREKGWRGIGTVPFELTLQSFDESRLIVYACDDVSGVQVVDGTGASVVSPNGQSRYAFEVEFDVTDSLRMTRKDLWSGGGVC